MGFSHIGGDGAVMVDISGKAVTARSARAAGRIRMSRACFALVREGRTHKGDVLAVAQIAGIQAAKRTPELIPLCHSLQLTGCELTFTLDDTTCEVEAVCTVRCQSKTGAEMEALTGVSAALLTVYDMCKSVDKHMEITGIRLLAKTGGKSGDFTHEGSEDA